MSTAKHTSGFYAGSRILEPFTEFTGLPIDQLNFITCQFLALSIAYPFRICLHPSRCSTVVRHMVELTLGIAMTLFCFGQQTLHLFAQSSLCLAIMCMFPIQYMHVLTFIAAMSYLAITHIYRQIYDYGGYTLDITGPLMIMTQKLTSLAFSYHDGAVKNIESLSQDQRQQMIRKFPTLLEYYSYMFYFHGIMCGPLSFYNDYLAFVDGSNFHTALASKYAGKENGHYKEPINSLHTPSPMELEMEERRLIRVSMFKKLTLAAGAGYLMMWVMPLFDSERLMNAAFFQMSFLSKLGLIYVVMLLTRQKYYFAWTLAEAVNHNAGLGFSGFDKDGKAEWELIKSVGIWPVEMGTSLKDIIDNWNCTSLVWLRRVIYDRAPFQKTLAVFLISAFWHGFYPGYYFMFLSAALCTMTARKVRRNFRPYFQTSQRKAKIYDIITWATTRVSISYITAPFLILELKPSFQLCNSVYWFVHIAALVLLLILPNKPSQSRKSTQSSKVNSHEQIPQEVNANDGNFKKVE